MHAKARLALSLAAAFTAALAAGCNNQDDAHLFGGDLSPTQMQRAEMGPGPAGQIEIDDGDSQDPFTGNPNYPFVEEPWSDN